MKSFRECVTLVYETLEPFLQEGQVLDENTALVADLGLSSLQVMELVAELEDSLDITIPLNSLPDVRSVKDLAEQIHMLAGQ